MLQHLLKFGIFLQCLAREYIVLLHRLRHRIERLAHVIDIFRQLLVALERLLGFLLLLPIERLVLLHFLRDLVEVLFKIFLFIKRLIQFLDRIVLTLVGIGKYFVERRKPEQIRLADSFLGPGNIVVVKYFSMVFHDVLRNQSHR